MNPTQEHLLQQLEQATATGATSNAPVDDETRDLRQSWFYLTQLLKETDAQEDEVELVPRAALPPRRHAWTTVAARALAASLLVAVSAPWLAVRAPVPREPQHAFPSESPRPTLAVAGEPSLDDELAWSDRLDEQLDAAGQTLIAIQSAWRSGDPLFRLLQDRLDRIEQEMQTGAL